MQAETLRSSWTLDGIRIFLVHDPKTSRFKVGTRWYWLGTFAKVDDGCAAFEALEMIEPCDHSLLRKFLTKETMKSTIVSAKPGKGSRKISDLIDRIERKMQCAGGLHAIQ